MQFVFDMGNKLTITLEGYVILVCPICGDEVEIDADNAGYCCEVKYSFRQSVVRDEFHNPIQMVYTLEETT